MGNSVLKCDQANAHATFVATLDRLSDPTVCMVRMLKRLQSDAEGLDRLRAGARSSSASSIYETHPEAVDLLNDALRAVLESEDENDVAGASSSGPEGRDGEPRTMKLAALSAFAARPAQERVDLLLRQRLITRTKQAHLCRGLLTRLRFTTLPPNHDAVRDLKLFLLAAMECIVIYASLEEQLPALGEEERKMVYGTAVSDQLSYWEVM
ncbi:unnamed protein product [Amoebophrya sp. A120]|nr:unnamed protein product [Amoebophrya sp. A120]|eukprot:GSA120T00001567001.1